MEEVSIWKEESSKFTEYVCCGAGIIEVLLSSSSLGISSDARLKMSNASCLAGAASLGEEDALRTGSYWLKSSKALNGFMGS